MEKTVILRHRKENLKKCSLRGLEGRGDLLFLTYPYKELPPFPGYILLTPGASPLSEEDLEHGLFLVDGTWRYAEVMVRQLEKEQAWIKRSLPTYWKTAYPRRQEVEEGLATVEALYIAHKILGRNCEGLLDHYHWRDLFLHKNQEI